MDIKIKSALISVSDKSGLDAVVKKLHEQNVKLISTGRTAQFISRIATPVIETNDPITALLAICSFSKILANNSI